MMKTFTNQELKDILVLPNIEIRSMFKSMVFFSDDIPFCLLNKGKLYVRASLKYKTLLIHSGFEPLILTKPYTETRVVSRYFPLPLDIESDTKRLNRILKKAHQLSRIEATQIRSVRRIRDLPNMQLKHERILHDIKIDSVEKFELIGAEQAIKGSKQ